MPDKRIALLLRVGGVSRCGRECYQPLLLWCPVACLHRPVHCPRLSLLRQPFGAASDVPLASMTTENDTKYVDGFLG